MMADSVVEGGSGKQERRPSVSVTTPARAAYGHARAYGHALTYAHVRAYVSLAVKGSGFVALLLSTVILLGGYVQSLGNKDFFCIMAISLIQAAGIFQDWDTNLQYFSVFLKIVDSVRGFLIGHFPAQGVKLVVFPFAVLLWCVLLFYLIGPLACAAISSWRIAKLNHWDGTDSMAAMMATLNIFYSLIIFQGTMFGVLLLPMRIYRATVVSRVHSLEQLWEEWGEDAICRYISHISEKCWKDPLSIKGMDLIKYGAELLDSEFHEDYLCGARLLSAFVKMGQDVSWVLLPSRHKIQRLIDSLMISSSNSLDEASVQFCLDGDSYCFAMTGGLDDRKEIRELAATIVAHVAVHIDDLSRYPGAMRCISSLLQHQEETTQKYRSRNSKKVPDPPLHQRPIRPLTKDEHNIEESIQIQIHMERRKRHLDLMRDQKRMELREHRHRNKSEGGTSSELVQQGLTILERLASNSDDNRRLICSAPRLLAKITAPVYSATLLEDVKTKAWADIVTRCLKVLYQLIRDPGNQIFSQHQVQSNLMSILLQVGNDEADHQELKLVTMDILSELSLDLSINLSDEIKKELITKQLQLFLPASGDDEESATIAGRAMVSMSTNSESNSGFIITTENGTIGRLTGMLDDVLITRRRRTIAAEIMANLCAHCNVDNDMKEILPKVLKKIMSIKTNRQGRQISVGYNNPALGDEEKQGNSVSTYNEEERYCIISTQEISDQKREEQEAFFSLAQVICDKLNSADLDDAIQKAVFYQSNAVSDEQRREAFVDKLKTIIDGNCHPAPAAGSLRIVKLCSRIAESTMRCQQYVEIFRNKGFRSSLSEASETMSELESCMLFVGTDFGPKKTVRPLFSEIEKSFGQI